MSCIYCSNHSFSHCRVIALAPSQILFKRKRLQHFPFEKGCWHFSFDRIFYIYKIFMYFYQSFRHFSRLRYFKLFVNSILFLHLRRHSATDTFSGHINLREYYTDADETFSKRPYSPRCVIKSYIRRSFCPNFTF